jgi:hypothetical protein
MIRYAKILRSYGSIIPPPLALPLLVPLPNQLKLFWVKKHSSPNVPTLSANPINSILITYNLSYKCCFALH